MLHLFHDDHRTVKQVNKKEIIFIKKYEFLSTKSYFCSRYNILMAIFSVMFLIMSWFFTRTMGGIGFIIANCCNMLARILHSYKFISSRYRDTPFDPLADLIPNKLFLSSLGGVWLITKITEVKSKNGLRKHFPKFIQNKLAYLFLLGFLQQTCSFPNRGNIICSCCWRLGIPGACISTTCHTQMER